MIAPDSRVSCVTWKNRICVTYERAASTYLYIAIPPLQRWFIFLKSSNQIHCQEDDIIGSLTPIRTTLLCSLIFRSAGKPRPSPETPESIAAKPTTTTIYQTTRTSAIPIGSKQRSSAMENSSQVVGRPRSGPRGAHEALQSLDKLRIYQAKVAAALNAKKYGGRYQSVAESRDGGGAS